MKRLVHMLLFLGLVSLTLSCSSKDDPTPDEAGNYYFRFKVDGTQVDYPYRTGIEHNLVGYVNLSSNEEDYYVVNIAGIRIISENNKNNLAFFMQNPTEFQINTNYANYETPANIVPDSFNIGYYDENGVLYIAGKIGSFVHGDAVIRFTEVADTHVTGTFSGTLARSGSNGDVSVQITEGEFNVPSFYQP